MHWGAAGRELPTTWIQDLVLGMVESFSREMIPMGTERMDVSVLPYDIISRGPIGKKNPTFLVFIVLTSTSPLVGGAL
jgi:hypothetical protein